MDPEAKKLLEETHTLVQENNKMLRSIKHHQKVASFLRSVYWVIVIGLGIGAFYFVQPYFDKVKNFFQDSSNTINSFKNSISKPQ